MISDRLLDRQAGGHAFDLDRRVCAKCGTTWEYFTDNGHGSSGATFVLQRKTNVWALGWTLENCGIIEGGEPSEFLARTVKVGRDIDVPVLIAMFTEMSRQETST